MRDRLENIIVPTRKAAKSRGYTPQGRSAGRNRRLTAAELAVMALKGADLRYDGSIFWAYATIVREEQRTGLFARMSDDQFSYAVRAAIMADRGHEKSYVDPEWEDDEIPGVGRRRRDRWYHEHREALLLAARENVLMWAREWCRV